jgi:hypothetical protein
MPIEYEFETICDIIGGGEIEIMVSRSVEDTEAVTGCINRPKIERQSPEVIAQRLQLMRNKPRDLAPVSELEEL